MTDSERSSSAAFGGLPPVEAKATVTGLPGRSENPESRTSSRFVPVLMMPVALALKRRSNAPLAAAVHPFHPRTSCQTGVKRCAGQAYLRFFIL